MHTSTLQRQMTAPTLVVEEPIYVDSFLEMQYLPEFRDKEYELINGKIIEMPAPGTILGKLVIRMGGQLDAFAMANDLGHVTGENGFASLYDTGLLLRPDVAFFGHSRFSVPLPRGWMPHMPDLVVEIHSPRDTLAAMREKADLYLRNGTQLVWLVFPDDKRIEVHATDETITTLGIDDALDGGDVLPGFALPLRRLFDL